MKQIAIGEAMNRKFPEWVGLLVTRGPGPEARPNLMPIGWIMCCSFEPPMIAVAIGNSRYSKELLCAEPRFVLAFAGAGQAELVRRAGACSGRETDKFAAFQIPHEPGPLTGCPLLTQAAFNLECRVVGTLATGDHTIFAAEVLAAYLPDRPIRKLENFGGGRLAPAIPGQ